MIMPALLLPVLFISLANAIEFDLNFQIMSGEQPHFTDVIAAYGSTVLAYDAANSEISVLTIPEGKFKTSASVSGETITCLSADDAEALAVTSTGKLYEWDYSSMFFPFNAEVAPKFQSVSQGLYVNARLSGYQDKTKVDVALVDPSAYDGAWLYVKYESDADWNKVAATPKFNGASEVPVAVEVGLKTAYVLTDANTLYAYHLDTNEWNDNSMPNIIALAADENGYDFSETSYKVFALEVGGKSMWSFTDSMFRYNFNVQLKDIDIGVNYMVGLGQSNGQIYYARSPSHFEEDAANAMVSIFTHPKSICDQLQEYYYIVGVMVTIVFVWFVWNSCNKVSKHQEYELIQEECTPLV